jgi:hypothetical protein
MKDKYSQAGQDKFVLSLFDKDHKGIFVDVGCHEPEKINNTLRLEENGWTGISLDIVDYGNMWKIRKTPFLIEDALKCNYKKIFENFKLPNSIDYLSLDIEGNGLRYQALKRVMESGYKFKVITVEHDAYRGYAFTERQPQRKLLNDMNYLLLCSDVLNGGNSFEDWWINPKFFNEPEYIRYMCSNLEYTKILNKIDK